MVMVPEGARSARKSKQIDGVYSRPKEFNPDADSTKHLKRDNDDDGEDDDLGNGEKDHDNDHHSSEQPILPLPPPVTGSTIVEDASHATTTDLATSPASTPPQGTGSIESRSPHHGTVSTSLVLITSTTSTSASPSDITITDISVSTTTATALASHTHTAIDTLTPDPALLHSETHEPQNALKAGISIAAISVFIALLYVLFRFCTPIRTRWLLRQEHRRLARQKRLGLNDTISAPPTVTTIPTRRTHTNAPTDVEIGQVQEADLRPPSYRSRYTASGASWVADGWLGSANRLSSRLTERWRQSDGSMRRIVFDISRFSDSSSGSREEKQGEVRRSAARRSGSSEINFPVSGLGSDLQRNAGRGSRGSEVSDMYGSEIDAGFDFRLPPAVLSNSSSFRGSGGGLIA